MPAYRSEAEAVVREDVVARLRLLFPDGRIIHEINVNGTGSNRIDVITVTPATIVAVEIKSEKDKLDRLADQVPAMRGVTQHVVCALHESHLVEKETHRGAAHRIREDGVPVLGDIPKEYETFPCAAPKYWVWPERRRALEPDGYDFNATWEAPKFRLNVALPETALNMLWAAELKTLCRELSIDVGKRATMTQTTEALKWYARGREITAGICRALRRRKCIEADPEIETPFPTSTWRRKSTLF